MVVEAAKNQQFLLDNEINAPIASLDLEDWLDFITSNNNSANTNEDLIGCKNKQEFPLINVKGNEIPFKNSSNNNSSTNLTDAIDLCSSLEDLVKTFDKNVKECLTNYKDIDIGQLAPVQVRLQEDIINDSQLWYTLTGNFGNLLPIDYWSKSLIRKYHNDSLNIKKNLTNLKENKFLKGKYKTNSSKNSNSDLEFNRKFLCTEIKKPTKSFSETFTNNNRYDDGIRFNARKTIDSDLSVQNFESLFDDENEDLHDYNYDYDEEDDDDNDDEDHKEDEDDYLNEYNNNNNEDEYEDANSSAFNYDEDEEELKEQLDMHSMILSKVEYNDEDLDEPLFTAEQVLDEIDSMMTMQEEICDEMTPDSGCYSTTCLSTSLSTNFNNDNVSIDLNGSYIKYINTFAIQNNTNTNLDESYHHDFSFIPTDKTQLNNLNIYQLNELIEQIENSTKELSETLVQEFALRDEQEYEKETRNTFISLLMSIQEKRRQLNSDVITHSNSRNLANLKKKNRRSLVNFNFDLSATSPTHLTTVIPYNCEIVYSVQHLQILNKLLRAINEDSHQVPELLTNYILKVVCPT